jgi:hypothetical protein
VSRQPYDRQQFQIGADRSMLSPGKPGDNTLKEG